MPPVEEKDKDKDEHEDILSDVDVVIESEPAEQASEEKPKEKEAEGKDDGKGERRGKAREEDDAEDRDELAGAKDDAEREKIRERRREERRLRKERQDAEARELRELRQKVRDLEERHTEIERTAKTGQYERVEAGINEAAGNMERAKAVMQKAAADGDWTAHTEALEAYNQWRSRGEYLVTVKNDIIARSQQEGRGQQKADPEVVRHAKQWMERNPWYDPQAGDADSRVAFRIDAALAAQGFDPRTAEYWKEFDKRLAKQLPHRVKLENADEADEDRDESSSRTSGSGRERAAQGKTVFKLSSARVAAMKEAGIWDDEAARKKQIKRYMEYDKQQQAQQQGARK